MNDNLEFENRLLVEKYLTLMKLLLKIADDYLNNQTSEIDIRLLEEIFKEQNEIFSRLIFKEFLQ